MITTGFAAAVVVIGFGYLIATVALSRRKLPVPSTGAEPERFVFVVPALNEERVIGATVHSLLGACGERGRVLVIDDGSTDTTGQILDRLRATHPDRVWVLTRRAPAARQGKGAALNAAYQLVRDTTLADGLNPSAVVLGIVDADGRLEPAVLAQVAPYFRDPRVGAVQLLVRIRNRARLLCRFQDYEFLVFSSLTQTAREKLGSVGLGGNGQFTRLAALMDLGEAPWTACLTEDLDLGVRLAIAGWQNRFCGETFVDQQGLDSLPRLLRQRTRWAHGHFQCWQLIPKVIASTLPTVTVLDLCYYLLAPAIVLASSVLFTVPLVLLITRIATDPRVWGSPGGLAYLGALYLISFGPALGLALVYQRRARDLSVFAAVLLGQLLAGYNYIWYLAEWKALVRILTRRTGWTKTSRIHEHPAHPIPSEGVGDPAPRPARHAAGTTGLVSLDELLERAS